MGVSDDAWKAIKNRKEPIPSFYCNLSYWDSCVENKLFPYTMPASDIMGFDQAIDNLLEEGIDEVVKRHHKVAKYCREKIQELGLKLYIEDGFASTVTSFYVPEGFTPNEFIKLLKEKHQILISGSYGDFAKYILRVGHMGESATIENIDKVIAGIKDILK